jgi:hypothetical protein
MPTFHTLPVTDSIKTRPLSFSCLFRWLHRVLRVTQFLSLWVKSLVHSHIFVGWTTASLPDRRLVCLSWRRPFCWVVVPPIPLLCVGILSFNMFWRQLFERQISMWENLCMLKIAFIRYIVQIPDTVISTPLCAKRKRGMPWPDVRFSQRWFWRVLSPGIYLHVVRWKATNVSECMLLLGATQQYIPGTLSDML